MAKVAVALAAAFMLASIAVIISIAVVQTHKKTYLSRGLKVKFLNLSMPDTRVCTGHKNIIGVYQSHVGSNACSSNACIHSNCLIILISLKKE